MFVTGSLDDGWSLVEVVVILSASLARAFVVFSTGTEARTPTEVVEAESDRREKETEQSWASPVGGVVIQGGLNHSYHGVELLVRLESID